MIEAFAVVMSLKYLLGSQNLISCRIWCSTCCKLFFCQHGFKSTCLFCHGITKWSFCSPGLWAGIIHPESEGSRLSGLPHRPPGGGAELWRQPGRRLLESPRRKDTIQRLDVKMSISLRLFLLCVWKAHISKGEILYICRLAGVCIWCDSQWVWSTVSWKN